VALRRAGYVRSAGSNVWSGSFRETDSTIEIRPTANQTRAALVTISFDSDSRISGLTGDGIPLETFTLEPEVLSNDLVSKAGGREALRFADLRRFWFTPFSPLRTIAFLNMLDSTCSVSVARCCETRATIVWGRAVQQSLNSSSRTLTFRPSAR
jgi:hypothetical protein